jgi:hypothetical protein
MKFRLLLLASGVCAGLPGPAAAAELPRQFDGATPLEWSQRLAASEMKRLGHSLEAGAGNAHWD